MHFSYALNEAPFIIMKQTLLIVGIVLIIYACSSQREVAQDNNKSIEVAAEDSVEYDVEMFDAKFDSWYEFQKSPAKNRSQQYYENWNHQYIAAWNAKCAAPPGGWGFEPVIGFEPNQDYGFELNHKLFYYFQYVENVLKIRILPNGPKVVLNEPEP